MARRLFNGRRFSEDGWPYVDEGSCRWVKIAADAEIQIQDGVPATVMGAFARDYDAYIEPIFNRDSACWTPGNSVATSNHPGATSMDLRWDSHPFQKVNTFNADQRATINELLDWYEGMIFWGGRWNSPKDEMHWQMGYDTYDQDNDRPEPKCQDFINRKIRADGFSTFRRGGTTAPPPPPPELSRADRYALLIIAEGQRRGIRPKGIQIALATGLVESNITVYANSKVPASMQIPHDAVGSDGYSVGIFQQQVRDTGNGWWWGDAATCMDPTSSAGLFYGRLANLPYNGNSKTPGAFAQQIQQSAFPDRYDQRFNDAVALYNRLSGAQPIEEGFLMALSDAEQREVLENARRQSRPRPSKSPLRPPGEGDIGDMNDVVGYIDGSIHWLAVRSAAELGHPKYLDLLQRVAADPTRPDDANLAQAILADIESKKAQPQAVSAPHAAPQPQVVYLPAPQPLAAAETASTGQTIGAAYDALESLRLADALPIEGRAPLAALIAVLQTKNGSNV